MSKKKKGGKGKKKKTQSKPTQATEEGAVVEETTTPDDAVDEEEVAADKEDQKEAPKPSGLPAGLEASLGLFSPKQQILLKLLCSPFLNQAHLFEQWSETSDPETDALKIQFVKQLEALDQAYPTGGLAGYIKNAKQLLEKSRKGVNPLEGWSPTVPTGQAFEIGTAEYDEVESVGMKELGSMGFVLVAGGLGERLGYGDIKIGLPTEMATETKYLQYYIEYILSLEKKHAPEGRKLPLCIMVSGDTNAGTLKLLADNNYFGMDKDQITIVQQGQGVPALTDNDARIALDSDYKILTKPHGHGDIHALLHSEEVAKKWLGQGVGWIAFFQDTNGLAFHTLPLALGVSAKFDLVMNSLAVPRKAKQAIGAITKLVNDKGESRTINVEYNQLDPLLRATGHPDGDVNDPATGLSPYPGNINQLLFKLKPYVDVLERTKGAMPEFVNPKYKDAEKMVFKKPTRLECMMQDFPTVLGGSEAEKVGFTSIAADLCFSPVKNATADGAALQAKGTAPGVAASGEADQYGAVRKIMRSIGCNVEDAPAATFNGITVVPGPQIVFGPDFVSCPADYKTAFPSPQKVNVSSKSSLVIKGDNLVIESVDLDGALVVECEEGAHGVIRNLTVSNKGWALSPVDNSSNEVIAMRGYVVDKKETRCIVFKKDGTIEGDYDPNAATKSTEEPKVETPTNGEAKAADSKPKTPAPTPPATAKAPELPNPKEPETPVPTAKAPEPPVKATTPPAPVAPPEPAAKAPEPPAKAATPPAPVAPPEPAAKTPEPPAKTATPPPAPVAPPEPAAETPKPAAEPVTAEPSKSRAAPVIEASSLPEKKVTTSKGADAGKRADRKPATLSEPAAEEAAEEQARLCDCVIL